VIAISIPGPWIDCVIEQHILSPLWTPTSIRAVSLASPVPARHIGKPVALHAPRRWSKAGLADGRVQRHLFGASGLDPGAVGFLALGLGPRGHILAVATIHDCHPARPPLEADDFCCAAWGDPPPASGFHLVLRGIHRLDPPVPVYRNRSGWRPWPLPDDIAAQLPTHPPAAPTKGVSPSTTDERNNR
jgi:hypothetical protein